jgi:hypothetical protein
MHNLEQYEIIEAFGEQHLERIIDLATLVLAKKLLPLARSKYGGSDEASLRKVLEDNSDARTAQHLDDTKNMAIAALKERGLPEQYEAEVEKLISRVPEIMLEFITGLAGRLGMVSVEDSESISTILAQMVSEVEDDRHQRNNQLEEPG